MEDSIFDRLFELLQSPGPVNWRLADEVIKSVAGAPEPVEPAIADEYSELTLAAELLLSDQPGLTIPSAARLHPVDRATWARENAQSFRYLVEPLAAKLGGDVGPSPLAALGPALLGMQAGSMVGFMAQQALGQFDAGLPALDHADRYVIVPNVEDFAAGHGLDSHQVRMWAVTREVAHHAVLDRDWYRAAFLEAVDDFFAGLEFDMSGMSEMLSSLQDPSQLEGMLAGGPDAITEMLGMKHDPQRLERLQAMIAITEGFGEYVTGRVAAPKLPQLERIAEAAARRRAEPEQGAELLQQLAGLDLQRHRAQDAADFSGEIARRWGDEALDELWESPDQLPTLAELTDPVGWAARVLL